MAWLSRVNFIASDTLSFSDINNLGNDIRSWGGNVNGGGYTLSNVAISATTLTASGLISGGSASITGAVSAGSISASGAVSAFSLTANGGINVNTGLVVTGGGQTGLVYVSGLGGMVVGTTSAHPLIVYVNNAERMRILTTGEVGIGTASPQTKLEVAGNIRASSTGATEMQLSTSSASTTTAHIIGALSDSGFNYANLILSSNATRFHISGSEKMRIDSTGNVGIGTTSPAASAKLDIGGTTGALLVPRLTTTERNALTAVNGMIIYNTTDNQMQGRINGAWAAM